MAALFRDSAQPPTPAATCADLPQLLLQALAPLMGNRRPEVTETFLPTTGANDLAIIDQRLRTWTSTAYAIWSADTAWSADTLRCILTCPMNEDARQSLLFLACAHPDGRERQKAVWNLGQFPCYLSLVAALLRSADWVPQVRFGAREAVQQLLRDCSAESILAAWPLVLRLQRWERVSDGWLEANVESWMLDPSNDAMLQRARSSTDPALRAWAYRVSIERGHAQLHGQALMQQDPRIGLHALRHARATLDAASIVAIATAGPHAPHPAVRRECLQALVSADPVKAATVLPSALLDRASGVRRLAAYLTRERGTDPRIAWRAAIDQDSKDDQIGALTSLAEEAEPEDAARLHKRLHATRASVRQQALKGLLRLKQPISPDTTSRLLQSGGGRVMDTLSHAIRDSTVTLDNALILLTLGDEATDAACRARLHKLMRIRSLWDGLMQLLALRVPEADRHWWLMAVDDWIDRSGTYAPLGELRKRMLLDAVSERTADLADERATKILAAVLRY
ncbi:MAG: hypothetical protein ABW002_06580 [Xanthomonas sp.]